MMNKSAKFYFNINTIYLFFSRNSKKNQFESTFFTRCGSYVGIVEEELIVVVAVELESGLHSALHGIP